MFARPLTLVRMQVEKCPPAFQIPFDYSELGFFCKNTFFFFFTFCMRQLMWSHSWTARACLNIDVKVSISYNSTKNTLKLSLAMQISQVMVWDCEGHFSPVSSLQSTFTTTVSLNDYMLRGMLKHALNLLWRTGITLKIFTYKKNSNYCEKIYKVAKSNSLFIFSQVSLQNAPND